MIYLYNTLTRSKEGFKPIQTGQVGMYHCGPTVYDRVHIGNLRAYVFADTLRRVFEYNDYNVTQVINITDVGHLVTDADSGEDKMTKGLRREGLPLTLAGMKELAERYTTEFIDDLAALNIKFPTFLPKASEHIAEDIAIIEKLVEQGYTYTTSDGLYFDTEKLSDYGKLARLQPVEKAESRLTESDESEKKNPRDFALWKFDTKLGWDSPFGQGFPGWHIECSGMSMKYLGETFDIHTGGIDHIPVHHTNEIAQSEAATGKPLAHYWLHVNFLNIDEAKISKSLGNTLTLHDLTEKGIDPLAYRYLLLGTHYRSELSFSWESLGAAGQALVRLRQVVTNTTEPDGEIDQSYRERFLTVINDDLGTPQALAIAWELARDENISRGNKRATLLDFDRVLGLELTRHTEVDVPEDVQALVHNRETARREQNWQLADDLRAQIEAKGWQVKDTPNGPQIVKLSTAPNRS